MSANSQQAIKISSILALIAIVGFLWSWNDRDAATRHESAEMRRELSVTQTKQATIERRLDALEAWREARAVNDAGTSQILAQIGTDLAVLKVQINLISQTLKPDKEKQ